MERPPIFINRPMTRGQIRKRYMRTINKKDIDWRNTTMMMKFLNETGKILNRYQSRLPTSTHRKVAKTVKKMRDLSLIPSAGRILPTDKIPLGSYIQDIEELHRKTIDPVTGRIFMKHTLQDDLRDKNARFKETLQRKTEDLASHLQGKDESQKETLRQRYIRELQMEETNALFPSPMRREWSLAQGKIIFEQLLTDQEKAKFFEDGDESVEKEISEKAYEKIMQRL